MLLKLIRAFHLQMIMSPEARAQFFGMLAEFLHLLKANLATAVDVIRVGTRNFVNEASCVVSHKINLG